MSFAVPRTPMASAPGLVRAWWAAATLVVTLASLAATARASPEDASLEEKILANKYRHGDYGIFFGWHDPWDWQFDEHGSSAWPIGLSVRLRWRDRFRLVGDLSYYRRSETPAYVVTLATAPQFDGLVLGASVQATLRSSGFWRPYVGTGPVGVSLGNDFLAFRPEVRDADPTDPGQVALADWSQFDVGWQVSSGVDFFLGGRVSPFVEYRHQFGKLTLDDENVTIGNFPLPTLGLTVEDLQTVPADLASGYGRPHSRRYDWSGPIVSVGLKVMF